MTTKTGEGLRRHHSDKFVKTHRNHRDGLWKKLDILGVVSETAIWQHIWYGELSFLAYNDVDRAFYESIISNTQ